MKQVKILIAIGCVFFACGCTDVPESKTETGEKTPLVFKYADLPGVSWIKNAKNFNDDHYTDSFRFYFHQSLDAGNYEHAAGYFISYLNIMSDLAQFDTAVVSEAVAFYELNETRISGEARSYLAHYLGTILYNMNEMNKSFEWFRIGTSIRPESNTHKQIQGFSHFALGQNFARLREFDSAEAHVVRTLRIFDDIGETKNQATAYLLMYSLYAKNGAYDDAEGYLQKALGILKHEQQTEYLTFSALSMYINFYIEQGDTVNTIRQIDSLSAFSNESYPDISVYHQGVLMQYLAFKFIALRQEDSALFYLDKARAISNSSGIPDLHMRTLFQEVLYADLLQKPLRNKDEVENFYHQLAGEEEPNKQLMYQIGSTLMDYYKNAGNYRKAFEYSDFLIHDAHKQTHGRLKNQLFELEKKYETEKKENTILLQTQRIQKKDRTIAMLVVGTLLSILSLFLVLAWAKTRQILRKNILTKQFTSQLIQKTEEERKRIAADLHDSVSNELIGLRHAFDEGQSDLKKKVDTILEEVRSISRNISPALFDKVGLKLSVEQLAERVQEQHDFFITADVDYHGGLDSIKELQLYRIIQEAITNMIKHAQARAGKIRINETVREVTIEIEDNGKGFNVEEMLRKGDSFGLLNITERAGYMNGKATIRSSGSGTIVHILIPK